MGGGTECWVSRRRPIPLVIRGSCRAPRLTMGAPKARNRDDADRLPVVVASADRILHTPNTDYRALAQHRPPHAAREARLAVASRKFRFARDSPLEGAVTS